MKENFVHLLVTVLFIVIMFGCKEIFKITFLKSLVVAFLVVLIIEVIIERKK